MNQETRLREMIERRRRAVDESVRSVRLEYERLPYADHAPVLYRIIAQLRQDLKEVLTTERDDA